MNKIIFLLIIVFGLAFSSSFAQKENFKELRELRNAPDTSKTVYLKNISKATESDDPKSGTVPIDEVTKIKTFEDPDNPGVFVTEATKPIADETSEPNKITFGKAKGKPMSKSKINQLNNSSPQAALYSNIELDQHAMRISANCQPLDTDGASGAAVVNLDGEFYVIPSKASSLPPRPQNDANVTVMGVDKNKNCVRDDIEYFIFENYGKKNQELLRRHMYAHAIWLRFYLIDGISEKSIQAVSRQNLKTGLCLNKLLGAKQSQYILTELFALMHNTDNRTIRYFENEEILTGFDIDIKASPSC